MAACCVSVIGVLCCAVLCVVCCYSSELSGVIWWSPRRRGATLSVADQGSRVCVGVWVLVRGKVAMECHNFWWQSGRSSTGQNTSPERSDCRNRARQHLDVRWASPFVFCRSSDDSGGVSPASFRRVLGERGRVLRVTQGLRWPALWPAVACEEPQRQDPKPPDCDLSRVPGVGNGALPLLTQRLFSKSGRMCFLLEFAPNRLRR